MTKMAAKWLKSVPNLLQKRLKNHTLWSRIYLYSPYKGVPPGFLPPFSPRKEPSFHETGTFAQKILNIDLDVRDPAPVSRPGIKLRARDD